MRYSRHTHRHRTNPRTMYVRVGTRAKMTKGAPDAAPRSVSPLVLHRAERSPLRTLQRRPVSRRGRRSPSSWRTKTTGRWSSPTAIWWTPSLLSTVLRRTAWLPRKQSTQFWREVNVTTVVTGHQRTAPHQDSVFGAEGELLKSGEERCMHALAKLDSCIIWRDYVVPSRKQLRKLKAKKKK